MKRKKVLAHSSNYDNAKRGTSNIKFIVVHYTGNDGDTDEGNASYFQGENRHASAHYFVDDDSCTLTVPEDCVAWHCGAKTYYHPSCRNANSIGVEMCDTVKDGTYQLSAATRENVIELIRELMNKYNIPITNVVRHYDVTHKNCPAYFVDDSKWQEFKDEISNEGYNPVSNIDGLTDILGTSQCNVNQMVNYLLSKNPNVAQSVIKMVPVYLTEGVIEGVRGDVAFAQSCIETGNFAFVNTAVTLDQNNFCGMGVTAAGMKGNSFSSPQLGIRAQIQHLKAYATDAKLNSDCIDPRYAYVSKGCAPYVEWLGIQENPNKKGWAAGANYGTKILNVINQIKAIDAGDTPVEEPKETLYKVQAGAYTGKGNAEYQLNKIKAKGFEAYIAYTAGKYKIFCGAFSSKENADTMVKKLKAAGFDAIIV